MRTRTLPFVVAALLLVFADAGLARADELTADLTSTEQGVTKQGKILVRGEKYRIEMPAPVGPDPIVLVDPAAGKTLVLVPRYKAYIEVPTDHFMSRMNDPFAAVAEMAKRYSVKEVGTEEYQGYPCRKDLIHYEDTKIAERLWSEELGFTLKITLLAREKPDTVSLTNIVEVDVAADLFEVPAGYEATTSEALAEKIDADPEMKAKEAAYERTRIRTAEVSARLAPGHEVRVAIRRGVQVGAEVKYGSGEPFVWSVMPLLADEPLRKEEEVRREGAGSIDFGEDLDADVIVLRGEEGEANLRLTLTGHRPLVLAKWQRFQQERGGRSFTVDSYLTRLVIRITSSPEEDAEARVVMGYFKAPREPGGKADRTELRIAEGETMVFEFGPDDLPSDVDYMIQSGLATIEILEDRRPKEEQRPF